MSSLALEKVTCARAHLCSMCLPAPSEYVEAGMVAGEWSLLVDVAREEISAPQDVHGEKLSGGLRCSSALPLGAQGSLH